MFNMKNTLTIFEEINIIVINFQEFVLPSIVGFKY